MPTVFRHARRRSRFHARLHAEKERSQAAERRRLREGANPRHLFDDDEWQHEWRCADEDTNASQGSSSASPDDHDDRGTKSPS